jgi:hypothetical protein
MIFSEADVRHIALERSFLCQLQLIYYLSYYEIPYYNTTHCLVIL